jgi:hypothetical protein
MKKLLSKKVLIWTSIILIVLIIGFLVTMNYATDYLLHSIIASSEVQNHNSDAVKNPDANQASTSSDPPSAISSTSAQSESVSSMNQASSSQQQPAASVPDPQKPDSKGSPSPMPPDSNQTASTPSGTTVEKKGYDGNITPEKVEQAQESVTLKEKALVSSILLKKLSSSDISLFVKMSGDGVTVEEKKQAKEIILKKLSEEEYNDLIAIAAKLGLSAGRDYKESQKEFQTK